MTEEELYQEVDKLLLDFSSLALTKRYQIAKKALAEDQHLQQIDQQRKKLQHGIRYLPDDKKHDRILACKKLQEEYDNHPLVINYRQLKEEVLQLIKPLTETRL